VYRRERKLLFACARSLGSGRGGADAVAGLVRTSLDWDYVLECAALNGLGPLLYSLLRDMDGAVPGGAMARLQSAYYANGLRNSLFMAALERVLGALQASGVDAVLLKGAALAESHWGNVALRPMADIDLLVREAALDRAEAALSSLGFAPEAGARREWYRRNHHHDAPWVDTAGGPMLELHRDLVPPGFGVTADLGGIWQRVRPARVGQAPALTLAPEDMVAHICLHTALADPLVGSVRSLMDLALVLGAARHLDWDEFVNRANRDGWARHAALTLAAARRVCGAAVPSPVIMHLYRRSRMRAVRAFVLEQIAVQRSLRCPPGRSVVPDWVVVAAAEELLRPNGSFGAVPRAVRRAAEDPNWVARACALPERLAPVRRVGALALRALAAGSPPVPTRAGR